MDQTTHFEENLKPRLEQLAYRSSRRFCYGCYKEAPTGRCSHCLSDDLMNLLPEVGCEYGIEWIIQHLIEANLKKVDTSAAFEESISQCYPETTTVGWLEMDTVTILKDSDPVSWSLAESEWVDSETQEGQLVSFDNGSTHYLIFDIESYLDDAEKDIPKIA